mgnify:CR=1 FL=1
MEEAMVRAELWRLTQAGWSLDLIGMLRALKTTAVQWGTEVQCDWNGGMIWMGPGDEVETQAKALRPMWRR